MIASRDEWAVLCIFIRVRAELRSGQVRLTPRVPGRVSQSGMGLCLSFAYSREGRDVSVHIHESWWSGRGLGWVRTARVPARVRIGIGHRICIFTMTSPKGGAFFCIFIRVREELGLRQSLGWVPSRVGVCSWGSNLHIHEDVTRGVCLLSAHSLASGWGLCWIRSGSVMVPARVGVDFGAKICIFMKFCAYL